MPLPQILEDIAKYLARGKKSSGISKELSVEDNIINLLNKLKGKGVELTDLSEVPGKVNNGRVVYSSGKGHLPIELGVDYSSPEHAQIALHEIGHAERAFDRAGATGILGKLRQESFYNLAAQESNILALQTLMMIPLGLSQDPSLTIPALQGMLATPLLYEELMASKSALDKLKEMGISKADINLARNNYLSYLGSYGKATLLIPAIAGAYALYKHNKNKPDVKGGEPKNVASGFGSPLNSAMIGAAKVISRR